MNAVIDSSGRDRQIEAIASFDPDFDQVAWLKRIAVPDQV